MVNGETDRGRLHSRTGVSTWGLDARSLKRPSKKRSRLRNVSAPALLVLSGASVLVENAVEGAG